jgi:hypothetical protein
MARVNPFERGPTGRTWMHRGYMCFLKQRNRQIRCIYQIKQCNLWMPREFLWENTSRGDCNHYIDLLAQKRLIEAKVFEEQKLAIEHIYERGTGEDRPFVNINAQRLIAMLRGEELLEVPIDARIRFVPPKGRYTANDIDAEILGDVLTEEYIRSIRRMVGDGVPILCAQMPEEKDLLEKYGVRLTDAVMHSGFNLAMARGTDYRGEQGEEAAQQAAPPAPVSETEVSNTSHTTHTETVSLITGNEQVPYFVKRLIRDQHLLWCGTSYDASGPWSEYHRDQSRLAALGIVIA